MSGGRRHPTRGASIPKQIMPPTWAQRRGGEQGRWAGHGQGQLWFKPSPCGAREGWLRASPCCTGSAALAWEKTKGPGEAICFTSPKSTHMLASHSWNGIREPRYLWALRLCPKAFSESQVPYRHCVQGLSSALLPTNSSTPALSFHGAAQSPLRARGTEEVTGSHLRPTSLWALDIITGLGEEAEAPVPGPRQPLTQVRAQPPRPQKLLRFPLPCATQGPVHSPQTPLIFYSEYILFLHSDNCIRKQLFLLLWSICFLALSV